MEHSEDVLACVPDWETRSISCCRTVARPMVLKLASLVLDHWQSLWLFCSSLDACVRASERAIALECWCVGTYQESHCIDTRASSLRSLTLVSRRFTPQLPILTLY